jgi:hypothetical protein
MLDDARSIDAAIGFRVKSGWAAAVLVAGTIESPQVLNRRVIDLCDPSDPESRQPYHAAMGKLETDEKKVERRRKIIIRAADRSVAELLSELNQARHLVRAAGLVVGSTIDPTRITNPHIRAHALEGRLFRTVLEQAVRSYGIACSVIVERNAYAQAAEALDRSEKDLKHVLAKCGRSLGGPWGADQKTAALAAWFALAQRLETR